MRNNEYSRTWYLRKQGMHALKFNLSTCLRFLSFQRHLLDPRKLLELPRTKTQNITYKFTQKWKTRKGMMKGLACRDLGSPRHANSKYGRWN